MRVCCRPSRGLPWRRRKHRPRVRFFQVYAPAVQWWRCWEAGLSEAVCGRPMLQPSARCLRNPWGARPATVTTNFPPRRCAHRSCFTPPARLIGMEAVGLEIFQTQGCPKGIWVVHGVSGGNHEVELRAICGSGYDHTSLGSAVATRSMIDPFGLGGVRIGVVFDIRCLVCSG
jgi:hypothetical protein